MKRHFTITISALAALLTGCATTSDYLASEPVRAPHSNGMVQNNDGQKGMTWELLETKDEAVRLQCDTKNGCNPYQGDMSCSAELPLLCFNETGEERPADLSTDSLGQYSRWSDGRVAATSPVSASRFKTIGEADAYCRAEFGPTWRTSEFHDGRHWGYWARANTKLSKRTRYWMDINDQSGGTCWDRDAVSQAQTKPKNGKGMTFSVRDWGPNQNYVAVGCDSGNKSHACNPYAGDKVCSAKLPVMCFKPGEQVKPRYITATNYKGWSGGSVALSKQKARGSQFETTADVNAFCEASWGKGWRAAEFHDGNYAKYTNGWNFWARSIGNMPEASWRYRFWANINDQQNGTCWDNTISADPHAKSKRKS